ncbi:Hypothetical protein CGLY_16475 (plasmid) [Corynebacterium glyciniphilum AJ 3170]|uniref:Uncharacterized protein n=1 Tax=Corynebacterium glyciniphilum AJ 3170 TaxID=1404245 RepID=X5DR29_9CORY|nr:Hypothetical protein CGLY_16475 [Corynebacterium glyciniphilum AJ 3170]
MGRRYCGPGISSSQEGSNHATVALHVGLYWGIWVRIRTNNVL